MLMTYQQACDWLEIDSSLTLDNSILKLAFRKAAMKEHPDKSDHDEATHRFQCVQHAHQHLLMCVARHTTGPTANHHDNNNDEDDDEDDDYDDEEDNDEDGEYFSSFEDLFRAYFRQYGIRIHFEGRSGVGGFGFGGPSSSSSSYYARQQRQEEEEEERRYDEYVEHLHQRTRDKEAEKRRKERQRQEELAEKRHQAQAEGRDFFEAWNIKALQQEATKRGLKNCKRGMPQQSIVELLIDDEAKKRLRRQLKVQAPLIDEWCHVVNLQQSKPEWNGKKVRAIDFFESK